MKKARQVMDRGKTSLFDLSEFDDDKVDFKLIDGAPAGKRKKKK